jgi:hypothetical protein
VFILSITLFAFNLVSRVFNASATNLIGLSIKRVNSEVTIGIIGFALMSESV